MTTVTPVISALTPISPTTGRFVGQETTPYPRPGISPPRVYLAFEPLTGFVSSACADPNSLYYSTINQPIYNMANLIGIAGTYHEKGTDILCDPTTGAPILLIRDNLASDPPGTPPTITAYNEDGTKYAGAITSLVACNGQWQLESGPNYCASNAPYSTVQMWDIAGPTPILKTTLWFDQTGAQVAKPNGAILGDCPPMHVFREVLTVAAQNVVPPLTHAYVNSNGADVADLIIGRTVFANGDPAVVFTPGSNAVTFNSVAAGFNLNVGDLVIAVYSY